MRVYVEMLGHRVELINDSRSFFDRKVQPLMDEDWVDTATAIQAGSSAK